MFVHIISKLLDLDQMRMGEPANNCSKLTIETLEQGLKYVQS